MLSASQHAGHKNIVESHNWDSPSRMAKNLLQSCSGIRVMFGVLLNISLFKMAASSLWSPLEVGTSPWAANAPSPHRSDGSVERTGTGRPMARRSLGGPTPLFPVHQVAGKAKEHGQTHGPPLTTTQLKGSATSHFNHGVASFPWTVQGPCATALVASCECHLSCRLWI